MIQLGILVHWSFYDLEPYLILSLNIIHTLTHTQMHIYIYIYIYIYICVCMCVCVCVCVCPSGVQIKVGSFNRSHLRIRLRTFMHLSG